MKIRDWCFRAVARIADAYQILGVQGLLTMVGSFSLWAWAASASDWLNAWGPIAWIASGFLGVAVCLGLINGWAFYVTKRNQAEAWGAMSKQIFAVNPLDNMFQNQRIRATDFFNPFDTNHRNKTFVDCEFSGPGVVVFLRSNVEMERLVDCDFIEVAENVQVRNVVCFDRATVRHGRFYRMTLLFPPGDARAFRAAHPNTLPFWLTPTAEREEPRRPPA